ncbi:MAG: glycosyltransferase family 39 protein [Coleofasciculaceae cyanobacterium]
MYINKRVIEIKKRIFQQDKSKLIVVLILVLGILLRFVNLEKKFYWGDEIRTSLRTSGHTVEDVVQEIYDGRIIEIESLHKYQFPNSEKDLVDTIKVLMTRPEHPPLYYLMARFWMQWFGDSVAVIRSLSALIGLMAFPCLYWLCLELFESPQVGWMAVVIIAVSPLHILYAQEARQYSLWTVAILLSSAGLLRAIRIKTKTGWATYAITLIIGLYSHLLFVLVAISQGVYVLARESGRMSTNVLNYGRATFISLITFIPWLLVIIINLSQATDAIAEGQKNASLSYLVDRWFRNINRVFFSADLGSANIFLVLLAIYSIYFICRYTPKPIWLFILSLVGVTSLALAIPDLLLGGRRSLAIRYMIPPYLGIQLAVAYLFSNKIFMYKNGKRRLWKIGLVLIISAGVIIGGMQSQREVIWSKNDDKAKFYLPAGQVINQSAHPLVISDTSPINVLTLSHQLDEKVKLQLISKPNILQIPDGFSNIFLLNPSESLQQAFKQQPNSPNSQLVLVLQRGADRQNNPQLWELLKP